MHLIDILTIVLAGLMVGNELTVSLFINPVMWKLDAQAQTRALSLFAGLLGRVMPFWYALCLVFFLIESFVRRGDPAFFPLLAASILWAIIILATIFLLVPINNRVAALAANAPLEQWLPEHKRWDRLHRVRVLLLLVALVLVVNTLLTTAR
ncbi:MAG TPA: anthrone oxygenase family protein [Edaphobacter sp.]|nr:anthrone oxygenase family protein [Edaphobacter sp.]